MELEKDVVKMPSSRKDVYRLLPVRSRTTRSNTGSYAGVEESDAPEEMYGSVLQPVPVIIVGSHYDLVPSTNQQPFLARTQDLVTEMKKRFALHSTYYTVNSMLEAFLSVFRFEEYLDISPKLFPLNCLKSVSAEIKLLKDHLCEVRSKLLEVCISTKYVWMARNTLQNGK